jgi:hypothetical protein
MIENDWELTGMESALRLYGELNTRPLRSCFKNYCACHSGVARRALPALVTFFKQLLKP